MSGFLKHRSCTALIRWVVIPWLFFACSGNFSVAQAATDITFQPTLSAVDWPNGTTDHISSPDLSSAEKFFESRELEEDEDDDSDPCIERYQSSLLSPNPPAKTAIPSFQHRKRIKLFILFHAWKSYLCFHSSLGQ